MSSGFAGPRGSLHLKVLATDGSVVAERRASNMVVRSGAGIIASLFAGKSTAAISQVQIGFATETGSADLKALTLPEPAVPLEDLRSPVKPENFQIDTTQPDAVEVRVNAVFKPVRDFTQVTEAGLLAGDELYNQVLFEPLDMRKDQEIALFWQVNFPFGH